MPHAPIETDHLVIGAGASALAFVDALLDASDADVVLVDRRARPGGHWNDAYPFVRLHQPSGWYGVASRPIVETDPDRSGYRRGATGTDVLAYFDALLHERLLPSGRVHWLPRHEVRRGTDGADVVVPLDGGPARRVTVRRRRVDATHARTEVPATHPPRYTVAPGVALVAPHRLQRIAALPSKVTVVGGGKTGMDSVLWLLEHGVPAAGIRWIVPHDFWLHDRAHLRTGAVHIAAGVRATMREFDAIAAARSTEDLLARLEADGLLLRLDRRVTPTRYRCAVVSRGELGRLRRVTDVVRMGHVQRIDAARLVLEHGTLAAHPDTLYVDCSARALQPPPALPVFDGDTIHLLMVAACRPMFSAALIGRVEAGIDDERLKNALCTPVPSPERPADWLRLRAATLANAERWSREPALHAWLRASRLDIVATLHGGARPEDAASAALLRARAHAARAATANLARLLGEQHGPMARSPTLTTPARPAKTV